MLIDDEVFVGAVVKHYPAIEVVSSVPDAIKKTLNLFELVRTDCDVWFFRTMLCYHGY